MNKENLIKKISKETGLKRKKTGKVFDKVIELISKDLRKKREVSIEGFGNFKIKRVEMKMLFGKDNSKTVYPPKDTIEFTLAEKFFMKPNGNE
ncbi:MAG: HU family DNA-binding protein [Ignavibacteria bacterium]